MAKKDDTQLDDWRYRYPSAEVSWNLTGDPAYCQQFVGEAKNMLYQLKNRMNIAVPKLKSLQDKRSPVPGTTIIVSSIFGQDFIEIDAGRAGLPSCSITILDLPDAIPPMKWYALGKETFTKVGGGWVITAPDGKPEVEGVDYIKTYYRLNLRDCNDCAPIDFSICKSDELALPICHPYTYDATKLLYLGEPVPYFQGFPLKVPPVLPDPKNHLIYSLYDSGQAEIIRFGSDSQGSYFLWKAYTEWGVYPPTSITFSRTGLGYLFLKAFVQFQGRDLCKFESIVKVDCCKKDISRRSIKQPDRPGMSGLWWESESGSFPQNCFNQPFMNYGAMKMCEVPSEISLDDLLTMACTPVKPVGFYVLPQINGSCLPYKWELIGPGRWTTGGNFSEIGYYNCAEADCHSEITIDVTDRCGTVATVHAAPCCGIVSGMYILYTSLLMGCGTSQELMAEQGCGPYTWAITSGGGTLTVENARGNPVIYTAPATNVNCVDNPTITVTDCCGNSASISLAINCYPPSTAYALGWGDWTLCIPCTVSTGWVPECGYANYCKIIYNGKEWSCDGTLLSSFNQDCGTKQMTCFYSGDGQGCDSGCPCKLCDEPGTGSSPWIGCRAEGGGCNSGSDCAIPCGSIVDARTDAMKQNGCCPLNPLTGLPYS